MKKLLVLIIILLVAVLMAATTPNEEQHKEKMMAAIKEYVDEEAQERGFGNNAVTQVGKSVVLQAIKTAINTKLKLDNYYLFNTTHVRMNGENKILSVGILGQVITFDKDMLREKLRKLTEM